jgi:single-strand DNA-binding protein
MKIKGQIVKVSEVKTKGEYKSREVWLKVDGEYPQTFNIQIGTKKADQFNLKVGQTAEMDINLKGRLWTSPDGEEKCFNTMECWAWSSVEEATQAPQSTAVPNTPVGQAPESDFDF